MFESDPACLRFEFAASLRYVGVVGSVCLFDFVVGLAADAVEQWGWDLGEAAGHLIDFDESWNVDGMLPCSIRVLAVVQLALGTHGLDKSSWPVIHACLDTRLEDQSSTRPSGSSDNSRLHTVLTNLKA